MSVGAAVAIRRLEVFLVRPTKYDDDGYLLRHVRGVLPSNTLACLHALTEDVRARGVLGAVELRTHLCDESVERVPERRIARLTRRRGVRVVVGLVGVQTSQFPRAADLARRLRARGVAVLMGGFHVSGTLAMLREIPADLRDLMAAGVTLVAGEVEETWAAILRDALAGTLAPRYDAIDAKPDLRHAPVPRLDRRVLRRFVYRHFGTIDAGRGCPFSCSFCTIINVQGRTMRAREAAGIARAVAANHRDLGTHHYFFTDDNFARNPQWRAIFAALIRLREEAGIPVRFLMQVDTLAHRIPDFAALAARAGCFQVFIGMESLNPASLADGGKRQNRVEDYAALVGAWRRAGVLTHVGYIIGFPHDTPASVRANLRTLREEIGVDVASFFMLSPLPGSVDHRRLVEAGTAMDADWSRYDTFHPVVDHPRMSRAEWRALYEEAWREFYTPAHMERQLARAPRAHYVTLLQMYLWYGAAALVERFHPMMTGFVRLKPRRDRRPGCVAEGRWRHLRRRVPELWAMARGYARLLGELRRLWHVTLPSRPGPAAASRVRPAPGSRRSLAAEARLWIAFGRTMFGRDAYAGDARRDNAAASATIAHAARQP
jgi:radical SAM superfamily enzyme YgiQ (UPF0313 family)